MSLRRDDFLNRRAEKFLDGKIQEIFDRRTPILLRLSSVGRGRAVVLEGLRRPRKSACHKLRKLVALLESDALLRIVAVYLRNLAVVSRIVEAASWELFS